MCVHQRSKDVCKENWPLPKNVIFELGNEHFFLKYVTTEIHVTLWLFNIAMDNGPFIDGLPSKNGGSFHGYVSHNQRVITINSLFITII